MSNDLRDYVDIHRAFGARRRARGERAWRIRAVIGLFRAPQFET
jgi:hypothetical protein